MRTVTLIFIGIGALAAVPQPARADDTAPSGSRFHDGFYFRVATGFGGYQENLHRAGDARDSTVSGVASVGEFAVGGAVRPGIVLGGGVYGTTLLDADRSDSGFWLVGPFVDWYLDPARGLHLQGAVGLSLTGTDVPAGEMTPGPVDVGGGVMLGIGYEWWVSPQWSVGVLGRVTSVFTRDDRQDATWTHSLGTSPCLLFTATYN